jgi:hypothetical protein
MLLSDMFSPAFRDYASVQGTFRTIVSQMTVGDLLAVNNKQYERDVTDKLKEKPALASLRPPLTIAAVLELAKESASPCVVVSGRDEHIQWGQAYSVRHPNALSLFGALMIPIVRMDHSHQLLQRNRFPFWNSQDELIAAMHDEGCNLPWWLFRLLAFLPVFPAQGVRRAEGQVRPEEWTVEEGLPGGLEAPEVAAMVWPLLSQTYQ